MLTFVRNYHDFDFAAYKRRDGSMVYLANDEGAIVPFTWHTNDLVLTDIYEALNSDRETFMAFVEETWQPGRFESGAEYVFRWCEDCGDIGEDDNGRTVNTGGWVCDRYCMDHYNFCNDCEEYFPNDDTTGIGPHCDHVVCTRCLRRNYTYCEHCDEYVADSMEHDHENEDCGCESPSQLFYLPVAGGEALRNEERRTITLPVGTISDVGLSAVITYLRSEGQFVAASEVEHLDPAWQTKRGNFTKRLSAASFKANEKLTPEVLSRVGCIAREHTGDTDTFTIDLTRDLNQDPSEFCYEGSCWWAEHSESRCALKSNGGFALRSFDLRRRLYDVEGRAWVMPLRRTDTGEHEMGNLTPTFDVETPDAFVVFNGYGDLENYIPARIMAQLTGMTYRKIVFRCSPMYVNSGSDGRGSVGYIIAGEQIAKRYTDGSLNLNLTQHASTYYTETIPTKELVDA